MPFSDIVYVICIFSSNPLIFSLTLFTKLDRLQGQLNHPIAPISQRKNLRNFLVKPIRMSLLKSRREKIQISSEKASLKVGP